MDFSRLDDQSIKKIIPPYNDQGFVIPNSHRHKLSQIRSFHRMGKNQQNEVVGNDPSSYPINNKPAPYPSYSCCIGINCHDLCSRTLSEENKKSVTDGYAHLIREALRKRADLLRDNILRKYHRERGVLVNKNEVFVLKEIDRVWFDPKSYNNFYFVSGQCRETINDGKIVCAKCEALSDRLPQKCYAE